MLRRKNTLPKYFFQRNQREGKHSKHFKMNWFLKIIVNTEHNPNKKNTKKLKYNLKFLNKTITGNGL